MKKPTHNKHTMKKELLFVGLDVHAQNIAIALAEGGGGEARTYGSIPNDLHALEKVFARLRKAHPGVELRVCRGGSDRLRPGAAARPTQDYCTVLGINPEEVRLAIRSRKGYWRLSGNGLVQRA